MSISSWQKTNYLGNSINNCYPFSNSNKLETSFIFEAPTNSNNKEKFKEILQASQVEKILLKDFTILYNKIMESNLTFMKLFISFIYKYSYIAGGYIRDAYLKTKPKDIDIFFNDKIHADVFEKEIISKFPHIFKKTKLNNYITTLAQIQNISYQLEYNANTKFKYNYDIFNDIKHLEFLPINFIFIKFGEPLQILDTFDFGQNQFAFDFKKLIYPKNNFLAVYPNENYWQHLIINEKNDNPFATIARTFHFIQEKGFKIYKAQYLKLIKLAASEDAIKNNLYLQNISIHS